MASIDKVSVRSEVDKIKEKFHQLNTSGKINDEVSILMNSMLIIIDIILSIFLEKQTKKNSKNSSIPPSQTEKDETALSDSKRKNKRKSENDIIVNNARVKETVIIIPVVECATCGENLKKIPISSTERRTRIDIQFEKVVEHFDAEIKCCPSCDSQVKAQFPTNLYGPLQYGVGLKAFAINLMMSQMVAIKRTQKLIFSMIGSRISESILLKYIWQLHKALDEWELKSLEKILEHKVIHVDETSLKVEQKNYWIHVYSSEELTLKFLHKKRGKEAINDINIIPRYGGTIIHDCWASYLSYHDCNHGLCGSHLLRELEFIINSNGYSWAVNMKKCLQKACKMVSNNKNKKLDIKNYANLQKQYRNILTRGNKELPIVPSKPAGQRGTMAKSDAHNLWERLKQYESAVLLFARDPHVAFTNNRAERDLRMSKVKQKVSGCFRTQKYAQAYCRISSYLQTMANKGYNPLIAIQMALSGDIITGCE